MKEGLGDLEYLVKEKMKHDYTKHDAEFILPIEGYKKIIYSTKLDKLPIGKDASVLLYILGKVITDILNEVGYHKWLPDFIKDTAIKLLLQKITESKMLLGAIVKASRTTQPQEDKTDGKKSNE